VFARNVYFAELKAGGREYNDWDSSRYGSFLRSRNAIAALAPATDANGKALAYAGDIVMYRGCTRCAMTAAALGLLPRSGYVHTNFGGDIQLLTPGGKQVFGIEGGAAGDRASSPRAAGISSCSRTAASCWGRAAS
jgi:hypothetical protein